jgi:hypothetical protein
VRCISQTGWAPSFLPQTSGTLKALRAAQLWLGQL